MLGPGERASLRVGCLVAPRQASFFWHIACQLHGQQLAASVHSVQNPKSQRRAETAFACDKGSEMEGEEAECSGDRKRRRKTPQDIQAIQLEDLREHFRQPLTEAAGALGISANSLKRVCRRWHIYKWPFRELQGIERLQQQISRSLASCPPADGATRLQLEIHLQQLERRKRGLMLEPAKTSEQDKTTQEASKESRPAAAAPVLEWMAQPHSAPMAYITPVVPLYQPTQLLLQQAFAPGDRSAAAAMAHPLLQCIDEIQAATVMLTRRVDELEKLLHNVIATAMSRPYMPAPSAAAASSKPQAEQKVATTTAPAENQETERTAEDEDDEEDEIGDASEEDST